MGMFDPKIVKWHKGLIDAIHARDEAKTISHLEHPQFKSAIDFKTGNLIDSLKERIAALHYWTDPFRYSRADIGVYIAEHAGHYFGKNIFEKFFIAEASDEAKAAYLHAAADSYDPSFVQYLVDHATPLDKVIGHSGCTALHIAAYKGRSDVVECLINAGADPRIKDKQMNTAADVAESEKHHGIAAYLREQMTKFSAKAMSTDGEAGDWRLISKHEISCISEKPQIGYRITGIFNFESGIYTQIAANTANGHESHSVTSMETLRAPQLVDRARNMLLQKGGEIPCKKLSVKTGVIAQ
jgi:hypothetical protein